jgi:hypothetical protein
MLAELSREPECRRGHGAVYDAVNAGQVRGVAERIIAALVRTRLRRMRYRPGLLDGFPKTRLDLTTPLVTPAIEDR